MITHQIRISKKDIKIGFSFEDVYYEVANKWVTVPYNVFDFIQHEPYLKHREVEVEDEVENPTEDNSEGEPSNGSEERKTEA